MANLTKVVPLDVVYTVGLIHDMGKVVPVQYVDDALPFFYRRIQNNGIPLVEVEHDVFGVTHTEAGGLLAEQ